MRKAIVNRDIAPIYTAPSRLSELADEALFGMVVEITCVCGEAAPTDRSQGGLTAAAHSLGEAAPNDRPHCGVAVAAHTLGEAAPTDRSHGGLTAAAHFGGGDGRLENWYKIKTHYRYVGFMETRHLICDDELTERWEQSPKQVVLAPYADILIAPGVKSPRAAGSPRGGVVAPVGAADKGWQRILTPDGSDGYIRVSALGPYADSVTSHIDESALRARIAESAKLYIGSQYRWGGKTPLGIDCSGLTAMAYLLNGIIIYRDANIVPGFAIHEIAVSDVKPCDLLFFPGHVAMYLGGDKYIHSTAKAGSDGVVINSLNPGDPDFRRDLLESLTCAGSVF